MKKYDKLSNKEKHNFKEFLILTFEFSDDVLAAIEKQKPIEYSGLKRPDCRGSSTIVPQQ